MLTNASLSPSAWVVRWAALVPAGGPVLDLAAGAGRHSRLFAAAGHPVLAVDRDVSALAPYPGIEILAADLEAGPWPLAERRFAGVVVNNYLHRPLLPRIVRAVATDGVLIYQTFAIGHERVGRPSNPDFLLQPGELLAAVAGELTVVAYEHGETARPAVVQRICAIRGDRPARLD